MARLKEVPISSRYIARAAYDSEQRVLELQLADGTKRTHRRVPEWKVDGLRSASSPGEYYLDHLAPIYQRYWFRKALIGAMPVLMLFGAILLVLLR
ncbi:KTSC domain-containing protein [Rhizobium sp. RU36D]|uniref:KTSC domain-containing protein n=1 Tax=Rhizobium sp. RU36D TaxID=1907415 RepID=UPI0009FCA36D|nr:KTSC domain-containing protein [Rhizobium sp. RU36D]